MSPAQIMAAWPKQRRASGLLERVCPHGVGHPDPHYLSLLTARARATWGIHGCDGCCTGDGPEEGADP